MGVNLKDLLIRKEVEADYFQHKTLAVDAFNNLYQYISTIRQRDGTPLMDSKGNITSHLSGLFFRTMNLMQKNIKFIFVFDGKAPKLKKQERERRRSLKQEAKKQYEIAKQREDVESMKKYAARTSILTTQMVDESKELLKAMGIPLVQAPSEGEAQAAFLVSKGEAFASVSQDYDSLLSGVPNLVQNLNVSKKKKTLYGYQTVKPEILNLTDNLNNLGIDIDQLIVLAILIGTDYNVGGVKGIGPKKAFTLVKKHGRDFDGVFKQAKWNDYFDFGWKEVFKTIKEMPTTTNYSIEQGGVDSEAIKKLLVDKHSFSGDRINKVLKSFDKLKQGKQQKGLGEFI